MLLSSTCKFKFSYLNLVSSILKVPAGTCTFKDFQVPGRILLYEIHVVGSYGRKDHKPGSAAACKKMRSEKRTSRFFAPNKSNKCFNDTSPNYVHGKCQRCRPQLRDLVVPCRNRLVPWSFSVSAWSFALVSEATSFSMCGERRQQKYLLKVV